ncbi:MAG: CoA pyrophosphatase [Rhodospirillales bacterium]|nr:CoA pyrophosphatase [Rhodospirillales bacterium]
MNADELLNRLAARRPSGRRSSPRSSDEQAGRPRGDHDLNPDLYDPELSLTRAAVLVPIVRRSPEMTVLLTRRTDHLYDHAGQISFPGGRIDPGDRDAPMAALRETEEEVGLPRGHVELVGELDTYVTRTGFEVTPLVGLLRPPFPMAPDSFEVAEVFEVPLGFFLDPANRQTHSRFYKGKERQFYVYEYGDYYIWGATAGMLVNLTEVLAGS